MNKFLPSHWGKSKLGSVCKTTSGGTPSRKNKEFYIGTIPWVKSGELNYNIIRDTDEKISAAAVNSSSAKVFPKGTLLVALYGATIGKLAILGTEAATNQAVCGIFENKDIYTKFLYWYLFAERQSLIKLGTGGAQPNISQTILKNFEIPLPPLPEQERIVAKIEELFSELDKGVEQLQTLQKQLKVYRQAVLKYAFEGKLTAEWRSQSQSLQSGSELLESIRAEREAQAKAQGKKLKPIAPFTPVEIAQLPELPQSWSWVKMGDVCIKIGDIDHKMPKNISGGFPYVSTKDFTDDLKISFDNVKYISEEDYLNLSRKIKPEKGDIIFPRYGTIGKNILVDFEREFLVSYSCAIIKPNHNIVISKFLYLYSLSPLITEEIRKYVVETTQANIGIASITKFIFPIVPLNEQEQIIQEIEQRLSIADQVEQTITTTLKQADTLRQSILKKSFSGELVTQEEQAKVQAISASAEQLQLF